MEPVKVSVIGLGTGARHLRHYEASDRARVVGLCDVDEARLQEFAADRPGVETFTDCSEMLNSDDIQAVTVAVPNHLHAPMTIEALRAGKHVLCEKPMATTTDEAREMKSVAEAEGRILMMHYNVRFMPLGYTLKRVFDSGSVGDVYHVAVNYTRRNSYPGAGGWFGQKDKSGGGPLIDLGVHVIDLSLWLMGHPRPVAAFGQTSDRMAKRRFQGTDVEFDCEDFAAGMIRLENDCTLYLAASWDGHQESERRNTMKFYGTRGSVSQDGSQFTLCREENGVPTVSALEQIESPQTCQDHFAECIAEGRQPTSTAEHGIIVMQILDALYESARTGHEVLID